MWGSDFRVSSFGLIELFLEDIPAGREGIFGLLKMAMGKLLFLPFLIGGGFTTG